MASTLQKLPGGSETRWHVLACAAALACLVLAILAVLGSFAFLPSGAVYFVPLAAVYLGIYGLLRSKVRPTVLRWPIAVGGVGMFAFPLLTLSIAFSVSGFSTTGSIIGFTFGLLALFAHGGLMLSAIKLRSLHPSVRERVAATRAERRVGLITVALVVFVLEWALMYLLSSPFDVHIHQALDESSAVNSVRTLNTAQVIYAQTYGKGFCRALRELEPSPTGSEPSASSAGLVPEILASGAKRSYRFYYIPGRPDTQGRITTYIFLARPQRYGSRSFFTDQTGVIRWTEEDRVATAYDSPLLP